MLSSVTSKPGDSAKNSTPKAVFAIFLTFSATLLSLCGTACVAAPESPSPLKVAVYKESKAGPAMAQAMARWNEACGAELFVLHAWENGIDSNDVIVMDAPALTEAQMKTQERFVMATTTREAPHRITVRQLCFTDDALCATGLTHELGHVLGLMHTDDIKTPSVMQPDVQDATATPTAFDLVQVRGLLGRAACPNAT